MAQIRRGTPNHRRGNAKNFTHKHAQARLEETVKPFNKQVTNSLYVDSVEVEYYQAMGKIGKPCTCEKVQVAHTHTALNNGPDESNVPAVVPARDDVHAGMGIELQDDDLFGDGPAEKLFGAIEVDVTGYDSLEDDDVDIPDEVYRETVTAEGDVVLTETSMYGSSANCGICYRVGFQPGYKAYGKQRSVLTTWDVERIEGYIINTSDTPNTFKRQGPEAPYTFVEFAIQVPKYFKSCTFSVRDNQQILSDRLVLLSGQPLTSAELKRVAGSTLSFRVKAAKFTHVVVEFDLGMDKVRANLGPESQMLDYTKLEAISNFPVVLPPSIHEVNTGDVIIIRDRKLVLKITDKERKITADKRQLEWVVQTRIVQKTEPLRKIALGTKIL